MPRFYVSGIIQIEVSAKDAAEAGRKAQARAVSLMAKSPTLNIGIEEETAELAAPLAIRELSEAEKDENTADNHCPICNEYESECLCEEG